MEIKDLVKKYGIIGVISNYELNVSNGKVIDLNIRNIDDALKMVGIKNDIKEKNIKDLSLNELWLVDLAKKLDNEIIIIGSISNYLNKKEQDYIKKLLIKLNNKYNKKIVIIDNNVEVFFDLAKYICVLENNELVYSTNDVFDNKLYKYTSMPKIIEFIKYVNKDKIVLKETTDILELIKDIFRSA